MSSTRPSAVAGDPPARARAAFDAPAYLFICSLDDWARLMGVRARVDEVLRESGPSLDAETVSTIGDRGRTAALRLLADIAELPRLQRLSLTLSVWRADQHPSVKRALVQLAGELADEPDGRPVDWLFPLELEQSTTSDRDIATILSRDGRSLSAPNVAANRSVARGKLIKLNPAYAPLLSSLLPYRKSPSAEWSEKHEERSTEEDRSIAAALQVAVDRGVRTFELFVQADCHRHLPMLPEYARHLRTGGVDAEVGGDPWHAVRGHVASCARCSAIVNDEALLPKERRGESVAGDLVDTDRRLDGRLERLVAGLLRRQDDDEVVLARCVRGLTAQTELRAESIDALVDVLDVCSRDLARPIRRALTVHRLRGNGPALAPAADAKALNRGEFRIDLDVAPTLSSQPHGVVTCKGSVIGSLTVDAEDLLLRLNSLDEVLNGVKPRLALQGMTAGQELSEPRAVEREVEDGTLEMRWVGSANLLRRVGGITVHGPDVGVKRWEQLAYGLAGQSRQARQEGRLLDGLALCRKELEMLRELRGQADSPKLVLREATALQRAAGICLELGRTAEATVLLERSRKASDDGALPALQCDALRGLGQVRAAEAEWDIAAELLGEALTLARALPTAARQERLRRSASIHAALGHVEIERGRDIAVDLLKTAVEEFESIDDHVGRAAALNGLALAQRAGGDVATALDVCSRAKAALGPREDLRGRELRLLAEIICTEGRLQHARGESDSAMNSFRDSLELMYRVGNRRGEGDAINAIGRVQQALGDVDAAVRSLTRAHEIFVETRDRHREAAVLGMLARARLTQARAATHDEVRRERLQEARARANESLDLRTAARGRAITLGVRGCISREEARTNPEAARGARDDYLESIMLREEIGDQRGLAVTLADLAELELDFDRAELARDHLKRALKIHDAIPNPREKVRAYELFAVAARRMGDDAKALAAIQDAVGLVEELRAAIADQDLRRRYFARSSSSHRELAHRLASRDPRRALSLADSTRARSLLDRAAPDGTLVYGPATKAFWEAGIEATAEPGLVALSYLIGENEGKVFVARDANVEVAHLDVSAAELRERTDALVAAVADGQPRYPHGHTLYRALVEPIEPLLAECTQLIVSPDAPIVDLPFELLLTKLPKGAKARDGGGYSWGSLPYLTRRFPISVAPSLAYFAHLRQHERAPDGGPLNALLVAVGQAGFPGGDASALLDSLADRFSARTNSYGRATVLEGSQASLAAARELIADPALRCLHVIAESHVEESPGRLPHPGALILGDGEPWTSEEIARAATTAALVTLNADGAANGRYVDGEGTTSLADAFLLAGARTVCAPKLPTSTELATELMLRVYRELGDEVTPAAALQKAQLSLIEEGKHPLQWAGWRITGDAATPLTPARTGEPATATAS